MIVGTGIDANAERRRMIGAFCHSWQDATQSIIARTAAGFPSGLPILAQNPPAGSFDEGIVGQHR